MDNGGESLVSRSGNMIIFKMLRPWAVRAASRAIEERLNSRHHVRREDLNGRGRGKSSGRDERGCDRCLD